MLRPCSTTCAKASNVVAALGTSSGRVCRPGFHGGLWRGLANAAWAARADRRALAQVSGALLVAPADVERETCHDALRNFAAHLVETTGISRHSVLLQVRFVKALAKTSVGKINKREMREELARV